MKNKYYLLGVLVSLLLLTGCVFKINHWPGANAIMTVSIFSLVLVFLPSALFSCYRAGGEKKKALFLAAYTSLLFIFLGAIFKILHWPGASVLLIIGMLMPIVFFLPVYLWFHFREKEESNANFLYIIFFLVAMSALTGFLAIDVSNDLLRDALRISDISSLSKYTELKSASLQSIETDRFVSETSERSGVILKWIQELKYEILISADDKNKDVIDNEGVLNIWYLHGLSNREASAKILVRQEQGERLRKEIEDFHAYLLSIPAININESLVYITGLPDLLCSDYNGAAMYSWDVNNVNDPVPVILLRLSQIENGIQLAMLEALAILNKPG